MMSAYNTALLSDIGILILGSLSLYVILATGQLSLGNAGFMAIGAYLASYLTVEQGFPITLALLLAGAGCAAIGVLTGVRLSDPGPTAIPLGAGLNLALSHDTDLRAWLLFPNVRGSGSTNSFGGGGGLELRF